MSSKKINEKNCLGTDHSTPWESSKQFYNSYNRNVGVIMWGFFWEISDLSRIIIKESSSEDIPGKD